MSTSNKLFQAASGGAGGDKVYVEDVFSTYLYDGIDSAALTIDNGIALADEGGMIWFKARNATENHCLYDTERGAGKVIFPDSTGTQLTNTGPNKVEFRYAGATGFQTGTSYGGSENGAGKEIVSWTFRKQAGFFDVVTYTGDGTSSRDIAHNLGSKPGFIITKRTNLAGNWTCYHQALGYEERIYLDLTNPKSTNSATWVQEPTATHFTVGSENTSGSTYVAYLFAHDDQSFGDNSDEAIIKCGSFEDGQGQIDVGFEPQFIIYKPYTQNFRWVMVDNMRGLDGVNTTRELNPNASDAESDGHSLTINATGFYNDSMGAGYPFIYIAIRRPMKTPAAGTEVFKPVARTGTGTTAAVTGVGFSPDLFIGNIRATAGYSNGVVDRLRGVSKKIVTSNTDAESAAAPITSFDMDGLSLTSDGNGFANENGKSYIQWLFKRAPGFFDVVIANASNPAVANPHNLGVVPEFIIIRRTVYTGNNWSVSTNHTSTTMTSKWLNSTSVSGQGLNTAYTANYNLLGAQPTATNFTMINQSDGPFACYLFATLAGVSKVGSYTGTGSDLNVDCGFSAGARFVLITRVDASGDWYIYDSARGIVAGNDPYLLLNSTAAEVTNTDYIDPLNAGFTVTSSAPVALNANGGTYIFLAIA